jgi:hypothetical protein
MVHAKAIITICTLVIIFSVMITLIIDEASYQAKMSSKEYIPFRAIPPLSRVVHYTECMANLRCSCGDIIELYTTEGNKYYIVTNIGKYELTIEQVRRLEKKYRIRIIV